MGEKNFHEFRCWLSFSATEPFLCWKLGHMHMTNTVSWENQGIHSVFFRKITPILCGISHWMQQNAEPNPSTRKYSNTLIIYMRMNTQCSPLNSMHCIVTSSGVSLWSKAELPLVGTEDSPFTKKTPIFIATQKDATNPPTHRDLLLTPNKTPNFFWNLDFFVLLVLPPQTKPYHPKLCSHTPLILQDL